MNIGVFRQEHAVLLRSASRLAGLAATLQTRADAINVRELIDGMDALLVDHLSKEDNDLYPLMMASDDYELRTLAQDAFADMGLLHGAWVAYRDQWTVDRIMVDASTFGAATAALVEALATRIAMENETLYPAADAVGLSASFVGRA